MTASGRSEPVFDVSVIDRLVELFGDRASARQLIEIFLQESPQLADSVAQGLADGDAEASRMAAHSLKSSAASVGALRLSAVSAGIEGALRSGEIGAARGELTQLQAELDQALDALAAEVIRLADAPTEANAPE